MKLMLLPLLVLASATAGAQVRAPGETYQVTMRGMSCKQSSTDQLDCTYTVGSDLRFVIAGVGQEDAAITVTSAGGFDGEYYFTFGMLHGCVIVKPGRRSTEAALARGDIPGMAFVSPSNGKVYPTWPECRETMRRSAT